MISWGIVYHRLRTVNLYRTAPKHVRPSQDYPANMAINSEDFDKALKFALCCIGKGDFTLKAEQLDAINDGKDIFLWLPRESLYYETLPFVFNYEHSDGGTGGGCSVLFVVSPLLYLMVD